MLDSDDARFTEMSRLALVQKHRLEPDYFRDIPFSEWGDLIFAPSTLVRVQDWLQKASADIGSPDEPAFYIFDAEQAIGFGKGSADVPTQVTHNQFLIVSSDSPCEPRLVTARETAQAQGFNLLSSHMRYSSCKPILDSMTPVQVKRLMGNGMHLKVEAAWMFYVLGNIIRVPGLTMPRMLTDFDSDDELEELEFSARQ